MSGYKFSLKTQFGGHTHTLIVDCRTLREAMSAFYDYFWEEYDVDVMALPLPLEAKLVYTDD